jgi:hypothetical protein
LASTLGTGKGALDKINAELKKEGLMESTGVETVTTKRDNTGVIVGGIDCLQAYRWLISPFNCVLFCIVCNVVMDLLRPVPLVHWTTALITHFFGVFFIFQVWWLVAWAEGLSSLR